MVKGSTYESFGEWLASFYFSCSQGKNFTKLWEDSRVSTEDLADPGAYTAVWHCLEKFGKGHPFKN